MTLRAAIAASLPAVLTLTACGPVEENPGPPGGVVYVAPPLEPRRNSSPSPDVHRWLEASASVRIQLATLREELAGLQQLHVENHFDDFLALDPDTLEPGQLYYLHHFLERGYFRIEREILIQLLESRRARAATSAPAQPAPADIAARLQAGLQRDETLLIDLETAIARYRSPGDEPFQIPAILTETEVADFRTKVTAALKAERLKISGLDARIASLQAPP